MAPRTTAEARKEFLRTSRATIAAGLSGPVDESTWPGLFWTAGLIVERTAIVRSALQRSIDSFPERSPGFRRATLQTVHGLFPGEFVREIASWLPQETDPRAFASGCACVLQAGDTADRRAVLLALLERRFEDHGSEPRLTALHRRLLVDPRDELASRPPLPELLAAPFTPGHPVVFSIHRIDRRWPGLAIVRRADGRFARSADGELFHVPHLALSSTNLPGTITYGNTPQGILTIRGTGIAENPFIGPTPYLHAKLPIEATIAEFLHRDADSPWSQDHYADLLPANWRDYLPTFEAWLAGLAGRSEILAHGTTIDPSFYVEEPFWPLTPSAGCLTASELWSPEDGRLVRSHQRALVDAFLADGIPNGYLVVVELDAEEAPVRLDELREAIEAAEATRQG